MLLQRLLLLTAAVAFAACSDNPYGSPSGGGGGGHTTMLTVSNDVFTPTPDTVPAGQVTFTWSNASHGHNVTWDSGPGTLPANSSTMMSGTYQPTLVAGTYAYHCTFHGTASAGMRGTIVVR